MPPVIPPRHSWGRSQLKAKLDALSPEAKRWLHNACNQMADVGDFIDFPKQRAEVCAAGLASYSAHAGLDLADGVMGTVYSENYLSAFALR